MSGTANSSHVPPIYGPSCCNAFCGKTTPTMYWIGGGGPFCEACVDNINQTRASSKGTS